MISDKIRPQHLERKAILYEANFCQIAQRLAPALETLIVGSEVLYYLKDKAELSRICDRLANALAPNGRLLSAHSFVLRDDLRHTGFDWHGPFGTKTIAESLSRVSRLTLERSIQTAPSFWPVSGVRSAS
jgi:hypothetical protein